MRSAMLKTIARVTATFLVVAAGCLGAYELWDYYMLSPWTRDARVQADVVSIAPDVSGFVDDLRVKDNQFVHKGTILLTLDRERYARALAAAQAVVAVRKSDMEKNQRIAVRREKLSADTLSIEARESAVFSADSAAASYQQAIADLSTAQLNLDRTVLLAPVNGFVTNLTLTVGQYVPVGTKVMALVNSDSYRVSGYFEETKIPAVKPGSQVKIYLMSGGPPLRGHVDSISRAI